METDGAGASEKAAKHLRGLGIIVPSPPSFTGPLGRTRDWSVRLYLFNLDNIRPKFVLPAFSFSSGSCLACVQLLPVSVRLSVVSSHSPEPSG